MPYGYPNVNIDFNIEEARDNSGNSGSTWCKSRWEAKANQLANNILWKWGFATTGQTLYYYKCANLQNLFGLWNYAKNYKGKGRPISALKARQLVNCEVLENAVLEAGQLYDDAVKRVNSAGMIGGAGAKNAKIDKHKWSVVRSFFLRATLYQDGANYNTCVEEAREDAWRAILAAAQASLDNRPAGISNVQLGGIIMAGTLGSILIVSKFVK